MRTNNIKSLDAADGSQSQNGTALYVGEIGGALLFSAQAPVNTGSAAGTLKLQWSIDKPDGRPGFAPSNWTDVTSSSATSDSSTKYAFQSILQTAEFIRAVYTVGSGTGTVTCRIKAVGVTH